MHGRMGFNDSHIHGILLPTIPLEIPRVNGRLSMDSPWSAFLYMGFDFSNKYTFRVIIFLDYFFFLIHM